MAKVLFIGKYPPVQGGTATAAYWRQKELVKHGLNFEVVTSIPRDNEFHIEYDIEEKHVHTLCDKVPWHIPYSQLYSERLVSKSLELADQQDFDLVEGSYLFPYGFAAFVVAKLLDKPLILRHAGSDLYRIPESRMFYRIMKEMALQAKIVVTNYESERVWKHISDNIKTVVSERYVPAPTVFSKAGKHVNVSFLGKVTEKWDRNQLEYYCSYLDLNRYEGNIQVYSNDYTISVFDNYFTAKGYKVEGHHFVMPEFVPEILKDTKYLLVSKIPDGIPEESNIYLEGIEAGCVPVCQMKETTGKSKPCFAEYIEKQCEIYEEALK